MLGLVDPGGLELVFKPGRRGSHRLHPHGDPRSPARQQRRTGQTAHRDGQFSCGNLINAAQNQIQDLGLQPVKGRHVAAHHGDAALVVLFVADQLLVGDLPAVDGLVHRLIDDAVHGVGYPRGGKAPQQRPHLCPRVQGKCQQPGYGQQQQRPPDLGAIRPPVIVEKSGTHSPTSSAFGSYQLMRKGLFIISVR